MQGGWKVGRKLVQQVGKLEGLGVKGKKPPLQAIKEWNPGDDPNLNWFN
jgi:hypothetical protein